MNDVDRHGNINDIYHSNVKMRTRIVRRNQKALRIYKGDSNVLVLLALLAM